mgnify:FL=1
MIGFNGMEIKEYVGDLEVVYHGIIFVSDNLKTRITIAGLLNIDFEFINDPQKPEGDIILFGKSPNLHITCNNCESIFGQGIPPSKIGFFRSKELWLGFIIKTYSTQPASVLRSIDYVLYQR